MIKNNGCCALELAKKLKELGIKQESYFQWFNQYPFSSNKWEIIRDLGVGEGEQMYSAFTVAELGELLPTGACILMQEHCFYCCFYETEVFADTEADARAKMLIYLIENNLV